MQKGTTPIHTFTLEIDTGTLKKARVIYAQNGKRVLTKEDCTLLGNTITVKLSQADTFLFDHKKKVEIQIRALMHSGDTYNSDIFEETVERCLDTEVLR
jgi:hypothetical protein